MTKYPKTVIITKIYIVQQCIVKGNYGIRNYSQQLYQSRLYQ